MRILLVEDEQLLGEGLQEALQLQGLVVDWVQDGQLARAALLAQSFDLVILDLGLPRVDGLTLIHELRQRQNHTPILVLTARDSVQARVAGLDAGADDYMLKPFDVTELLARIRALMRRAHGQTSNVLHCGRISLDVAKHQVQCDGRMISLSRHEFAVLRELCLHAGEVRSKAQLEDSLYGWGEEIESNTLEVYIHHLRKKLYADAIKTIRGVGYLLES